jgi:type II secretory pathway pseudopilin PulG
MTLMELMVVIGLIAGLMAITAFGMGFLTRADVQGDALRVSGIIRFVYNASATQNRTLQLMIDLDNGTLSVDELDVSGGLTLEELAGKTLKSSEMEESTFGKRANRLDEEDENFTRIQRTTMAGPLLGDEDRELSPAVYFLGVMTSHHESLQTEGVATINFFPSGFVERSIIYIGDEQAKESDDEGVVYSLLVHPLTGQTSIKMGRVKIEESFFEEEAD